MFNLNLSPDETKTLDAIANNYRPPSSCDVSFLAAIVGKIVKAMNKEDKAKWDRVVNKDWGEP